MSKPKLDIRTNNTPRHTLSGYELTDKERQEFDWLTPEQINDQTFFRYKGQVYALSEIDRCQGEVKDLGWDGSADLSAFHAVLVKVVDAGEKVIVGQIFS